MRGVHKVNIFNSICIISVVGFISVSAQTLEEKLIVAKITPEYQLFEAEIKRTELFIKELNREINQALKKNNGILISDLRHGETQAMKYKTYLRVQQNYILEIMMGGEINPLLDRIKRLNDEIKNLVIGDESLDLLLSDKISGSGGGGGKIIKTNNKEANDLLRNLKNAIFGGNKTIFTESEVKLLRQEIHRRKATLSGALEALEDILVEGNQLITADQAQSKFLVKTKKLVATGKYLSYARLRDFIGEPQMVLKKNRKGYVSFLSTKNIPDQSIGLRQATRLQRISQTTFPDATFTASKSVGKLTTMGRGIGILKGLGSVIFHRVTNMAMLPLEPLQMYYNQPTQARAQYDAMDHELMIILCRDLPELRIQEKTYQVVHDTIMLAEVQKNIKTLKERAEKLKGDMSVWEGTNQKEYGDIIKSKFIKESADCENAISLPSSPFNTF